MVGFHYLAVLWLIIHFNTSSCCLPMFLDIFGIKKCFYLEYVCNDLLCFAIYGGEFHRSTTHWVRLFHLIFGLFPTSLYHSWSLSQSLSTFCLLHILAGFHNYLDNKFSYFVCCNDVIPFFQFRPRCISSLAEALDTSTTEITCLRKHGFPSTMVDQALACIYSISHT